MSNQTLHIVHSGRPKSCQSYLCLTASTRRDDREQLLQHVCQPMTPYQFSAHAGRRAAMAKCPGTPCSLLTAHPIQNLCELASTRCMQARQRRVSRHQGHRRRLHPRVRSPQRSTPSRRSMRSRLRQRSARCMWTSLGAPTQFLRMASESGQPAWGAVTAWGFRDNR